MDLSNRMLCSWSSYVPVKYRSRSRIILSTLRSALSDGHGMLGNFLRHRQSERCLQPCVLSRIRESVLLGHLLNDPWQTPCVELAGLFHRKDRFVLILSWLVSLRDQSETFGVGNLRPNRGILRFGQ